MASINRIKINRKKIWQPLLIPFFFYCFLFFVFILSLVKYFEILPKYSVQSFIWNFFALNWCIFVVLTNKKLLLPLYCRLNTNLLFGCVKLLGYFASAGYVVSFNFCVGTSSRMISLLLLSTCTDEPISASKLMTFLPMLSSVNKNSEQEWHPMPYPLDFHLSGSRVLVTFADPNK